MFELKIARKYLSPMGKGFTSIISCFSFLGIFLGVATLIIVMSVMNGFHEELLQKIVGLNGHIWVHNTDGSLQEDSMIENAIQKVSGVKSAHGAIERQAVAMMFSNARGVAVHGVKQLPSGLAKALKEGNFSSLLIGDRLAEKMHLKIGDSLKLMIPNGQTTAFGMMPKYQTFQISGIYSFGMHEYDSAVVIMPLKDAQDFFNLKGQISNYEITVNHLDETPMVLARLEKLFPEWKIFDWQHGNASFFKAVEIERNVMFIILSLIVLIAAFNIISSLVMLVKDKTEAIAIMRTMGASSSSIKGIFFIIGGGIGVSGALFGSLLGLFVSYNIEGIRKYLEQFLGNDLFQAEVYFLTKLPSKVILNEVLIVAGFAVLLSLLASWYPAYQASKLDPIKALRC